MWLHPENARPVIWGDCWRLLIGAGDFMAFLSFRDRTHIDF
jgi:hypothetical protein